MSTPEEDASKPKTPLMLAEDVVTGFLNGGTCSLTVHKEASLLEKLVMLKSLRLELPHISTQPSELDLLIRRELKKEISK